MAPVLGIDLGTTNSVVAIVDGGKPRVLPDSEGVNLIPSVVSFHPSGDILVGRTARDRRLLDAQNTIYSVKRLIGRPFKSDEVTQAQSRFAFQLQEGPTGGVLVSARKESYTLSEISAFVLREVRNVAEQAIGETCTKAVVTVPANFNELQRSATKAAGRVAGLDVLRILNEPTAAALAYGYGRGSKERIAIFDFGGGTFDMTVLELSGDVFEVLATAGDTYLGGDDVDVLIADEMAKSFLEHHRYDPRQDGQAYERLRAAAEWTKCQLSTEQEVQLRVEELAYGDGGVSLDLTFNLHRSTLESLARPLLTRSFEVCDETMRIAGLAPTQLDNIILVGGSTRIPLVRQLVQEYFGKKPLSNIDPDLVVAQGAGIQGAVLTVPDDGPATTGNLGRLRLKRMTKTDLAAQKAVAPPPLMSSAGQDAVRAAGVPSFEGDERATMLRMPNVSDDQQTQVRASAPPPLPPPASAPEPFVPEAGPSPEQVAAAAMADVSMEDLDSLDPDDVEEIEPPLLLDVTPQSLGIETVGGFCEQVIQRNAAIPVEQTRVFSTARDDQAEVEVRICQGESRRLEENQGLGAVVLSGLPPGARGSVKIEVTFVISAEGTLGVRAKDVATGQEQTIRISLVGGLADEDIARMQERQAQLVGAP